MTGRLYIHCVHTYAFCRIRVPFTPLAACVADGLPHKGREEVRLEPKSRMDAERWALLVSQPISDVTDWRSALTGMPHRMLFDTALLSPGHFELVREFRCRDVPARILALGMLKMFMVV